MAAGIDAVLVAAGRGVRLGAPVDKAFVKLRGQEMLVRAARMLDSSPLVSRLVVVAPPGREDEARRLLGPLSKVAACVAGGAERADSVREGLAALGLGGASAAPLVAVHDAARPLASGALLARLAHAIPGWQGVVPVLPIGDTVKEVEGDKVLRTLDRGRLVAVQTPQLFDAAALAEAHARASAEGFSGTDDAQLLERAGFAVRTVEGEAHNLKITLPEDLELAEHWLGSGGL